MAVESTFDLVSEFNYQELINAVDQTRKEVLARYDLKDSKTVLELSNKELIITTDGELHLTSVRDILETKALRRGLALKIFSYGKMEGTGGLRVRQVITLNQGINAELAKQIQKLVRDKFPKVQVRIQGETLRVGSKSKDTLQEVIVFIREHEAEFPVPIQFINYR